MIAAPTSPLASMRALLAFVALLLAYRLWALDHAGISLFFDEAQYWEWSRQLEWGYYSKPPLIAALIRLSTALFGDGLIGVKLLTMLLYPASALLLVALARALWPGDAGGRTGLAAAALFMSLPMTGLLGLFATTDAPLIFCWALAAWALWQAQRSDRLHYWLLCGLACGLGLLAKYTMAAFALTALWAIFFMPGPRRGVWRPGPWLTAAVALLLLAPNLWWNYQNDFPTLAHTAEITTASTRGGGVLAALAFLAGQVLMLGPVTVVGALWLARRGGEGIANDGDGYRYLWAMSLPLQLIAVAQSLHASAHVNWAAPSLLGFCLLAAACLRPPRQNPAPGTGARWLALALVTNLLLAAVVLHLRDFVGPGLPSKLDVLVRMRGWDQAFAELAPVLREPAAQRLPVLTDQRLLITHAAYQWRDEHPVLLMWNPEQRRQNHYELTRSLPDLPGQDVLLLSDHPQPHSITSRFASASLLRSVRVEVGPGRALELHLLLLKGFLGYGKTPASGAGKP